ncbi:type II toxin-antitoxin system PemK/MazF family toxin [Streptomyces sp. NBC_01727]|uniref:type II toxin-antitoxin system PemK/MazF family toxin n=1 Tax=Streptomyces sp. NBC_01727 TaxID=2975924 RepID=UPI002E0E23BF|nr:type II toxin-antitoxin system PemK/MazF family toxin [Streptomyces sp. NBC_01727]
MRRGEVWWADFGERRPVVLLSPAGDSGFRGVQIVESAGVDLSGFGVEVTVGAAEGLPVDGVVRVAFPRPGMTPCTWLATVTERDVIERAGVLPEAKVSEIEEALRLGGTGAGPDAD